MAFVESSGLRGRRGRLLWRYGGVIPFLLLVSWKNRSPQRDTEETLAEYCRERGAD
jgi:hypothetical protein